MKEYNIKEVEFKNVKGYTLRGYLNFPKGADEIVVFFHGFTGNKTEHAGHFRSLSRILADNGIASLRMDYHGNGESDGEFSDFIFEDGLDDCYRMLDYARKLDGIKNVSILGFSMGGAIASLVCDNTIHKLVLWSAAGHMKEHAIRDFETWHKLPNGNVFYAGFELSKEFVESIKKFDMYSNTSNYDGEVLICQGSKDLSVDPEDALRYHKEYRNSKLVMIEGAGHGYDGKEQMTQLYDETLKFLKDRK